MSSVSNPPPYEYTTSDNVDSYPQNEQFTEYEVPSPHDFKNDNNFLSKKSFDKSYNSQLHDIKLGIGSSFALAGLEIFVFYFIF